MSILQWLFSFKFTQHSAAAIVGTGIATVPLFGILDTKLTHEITEVKHLIDERATIVYVDGQDKVLALNVNSVSETLKEIKENQKVTNSRLWELVQEKRR